MTSVSMMMMTVDTDRLTKTKRIATSTRGSEMCARSKGGTLGRKAERLATWRAKVSASNSKATHMITAEELKKMIAETQRPLARDSRHTLVFHFRGCARNSPHSPMAAPQQTSSPDARSRMDRFFQRFNSRNARWKHHPAGDNSEASTT